MTNSTCNSIKAEYDKRQKEIWEKQNAYKIALYAKVPRLKKLDEEIQKLGIQSSKALLNNVSTYDVVVETLEELKLKKSKLLVQYGYTSDCLEPEYVCEACKDTGFIEESGNLTECHCYKQQLMERLYQQFNLRLTEFENFDFFDANLYNAMVSEKYGVSISPRDNILNIKEKALQFIQNFSLPNTKNLFFTGPTGVGKTFMANCIAREMLRKGFTVLYSTAANMFGMISEYKASNYRNSEDRADTETYYKNILNSDLLIIDDLGTEPITASRYAEFLNILDARRVNNLTSPPCKIIISTNLGLKEIKDSYTERVLSRIVQSFDMQLFWGEDIRKKSR